MEYDRCTDYRSKLIKIIEHMDQRQAFLVLRFVLGLTGQR